MYLKYTNYFLNCTFIERFDFFSAGISHEEFDVLWERGTQSMLHQLSKIDMEIFKVLGERRVCLTYIYILFCYYYLYLFSKILPQRQFLLLRNSIHSALLLTQLRLRS